MKSQIFSVRRKQNKLVDFLSSFLPIYKYTISGNSMSPLLKQGQTVLVNRLHYMFQNPQVSDIVVVKHPTKDMHLIKQITEIKNGKYFVVGLNKEQSTDSRSFGWIERKHIIGKVVV